MASDLEILKRLYNKPVDPDIDFYNEHFDGKRIPKHLGMSLPPELQSLRLVLNYCRAVGNAYDERLEIDGFRVAGSTAKADRFSKWWQFNNLDEKSSLGHIEALVAKRAFIVIGANPDDPETPLFTVEPAGSMRIETDPRTQKVTAALRLYTKGGKSTDVTHATLYLPDETVYYIHQSGQWLEDPDYDRDVHNMGTVPVVPLVNRARLGDLEGRSELADVVPFQDAACRSLTTLQGAQELLALPQRYALGVKEEDFLDQDGNLVSDWEVRMGSIWALKNEAAKVGQFEGAQLSNFTSTIMFYSRNVSAVSGVPIRYLGIAGDVNGASGDAISEDDTKLIKRAERMARNFSGAWELALQIGARIVDGAWDPELNSIEVVWRDPATPTLASIADAAVKLYTAENPTEGALLPREAVWEAIGFGVEKRKELKSLFQSDPLAAILRLAGTDGPGDVLEGTSNPVEQPSPSTGS